jgi:DNA-directed RNA polymerase specialized sigma subunit
MTAPRLNRVRLLQLREDLRTEQAAVEEALRLVQAALDGVMKLLTRRSGPMADRNRAIIAAVRAGEDQKDVAKRFGITQQRVSQIVRERAAKASRP